MKFSPTEKMSPMADAGIASSPVLQWHGNQELRAIDENLAAEAPLAIEVAYERNGQRVRKVVAVTMRTPGADEELAWGFLRSEGLIEKFADVAESISLPENVRGEKISTWAITLVQPAPEELQRVSRGIVTSSACGLCGRTTLVGLPKPDVESDAGGGKIACALLARLPEKLLGQQRLFAVSGGSHAAGLADFAGSFLIVREDVGRHNAVDKLLGAALRENISGREKILVLSGRASFELVQKAAASGVPVVVAVGAPSSLAVQLAHDTGITLVGFARGERCNIYTHAARLDLSHTGARAERASSDLKTA